MTRASGISVPLFSLSRQTSWGLGEFPDLVAVLPLGGRGGAVARADPAGHGAAGAGALAVFGADVVCARSHLHRRCRDVQDFEALGGEHLFDGRGSAWRSPTFAARRGALREVRRLKHRWLRRAWERFTRLEIAGRHASRRCVRCLLRRESWWLDDYAACSAALARSSRPTAPGGSGPKRATGRLDAVVAHARGRLARRDGLS